MKRIRIRTEKALPCLLVIALLLAFSSSALAVPYRTFTLGVDGDLIQTQTAYEPLRAMTRFSEETLKTPADMRMGKDGNLYIADTGNTRVVVITPQGDLVKIIGDKKTLKSAQGVFVDDDLYVYVADEKGRQVVVFDPEGRVTRTYTRPTHPLFGETAPFKPSKIVLDKRGNLYIASTGNTNGIVQISPNGEGEFLGYYGANTSNVSWLTAIKKAVLSEEQLSTMADIVPTSVKNLTIDEKGMVYTVSQTTDLTALRRLNVAGKNTLSPDYALEQLTCVSVTSSGSIFTANASGYLTEYTSEGALLFDFGAFDNGDQRIGTFKSVTGLVVTDDYTVYVLDEILGSVQVLRPTEFTDLVHTAFTLFQDGKYAESKAPWTQVLRMNSLFTYASTGLGEAMYREGQFSEALEAFRNGGNKQGYSDAFWEMRSDWLHSSLAIILIAVVGLLVLRKILSAVNRRTHFLAPLTRSRAAVGRVPIFSQLSWCFFMLRNPYDCCYGIKREKRASFVSAGLIVVLFFILFVLVKYFSGFLFSTVRSGEYEILRDTAMVYGAFLLLVTCCYLVCTINDGEATYKDLFIGSAYALAPMLIFLPIRLFLTNVLTYNEQFFITLLDVVSYGWTGLLIILEIMYLNDYSLKKTFGIIVLTLFTVLIAVALLFVLYVLISQIVDFVASIYGEVVYRFVRQA